VEISKDNGRKCGKGKYKLEKEKNKKIKETRN
jgi:hypothetical protein